MSLAAVLLAVVLTVFTLTLTTPGATQETTTPQETTTQQIPESNIPDNNCTFTVGNTTYELNEGDMKSVSDEVGTSYTWYLCQNGTVISGTVACKESERCVDVRSGSIIEGNHTCVHCLSLYYNCPNDTDSNSNSNETETEETGTGTSTSTDTDTETVASEISEEQRCDNVKRSTDDCLSDPAYMFPNCCDFCYRQRNAPLSEYNNKTLQSLYNGEED